MTLASFSPEGNAALGSALRLAVAALLALGVVALAVASPGDSLEAPAEPVPSGGAAATGIGSAGLPGGEAEPLPEDVAGVIGGDAVLPAARLRFEVHVGRREMAQGLATQAAERFRRVTQSAPAHPGGWYLLSRALAATGDLAGAKGAAEEALSRLEAAPPEVRGGFDAAEFHHALGAILADMVAWSDAEAELRRAVEIDPGHARAWYRLGDLLLRRARDAEAISALRQASTLRPRDAEPKLALAKALLRQDGLDEAKVVLDALREAAPADPEVHFLLASLHRARGDFDAQEASLGEFERLRAPLEARRLAGEAVDTLLREASLHVQAGRHAEAAAALEKVLADPLVVETGFRRARALSDLAHARAAEGDATRAAELYLASLAERPGSFVASYELGVLLAREGHVDLALPHLLAATDISPFHAGAHHNLGLAWGLVGRLSAALGEMRKAATLDPEDLAVRQALVDLEWALGHHAQAQAVAALGGVTLPSAEGPPTPPAGGTEGQGP